MKIDVQLIEIIVELHAVFNDYDKVFHWLHTENLNVGGAKPIELINRGRGNKVLQFIKEQKEL